MASKYCPRRGLGINSVVLSTLASELSVRSVDFIDHCTL